jgi:hypothetical protein
MKTPIKKSRINISEVVSTALPLTLRKSKVTFTKPNCKIHFVRKNARFAASQTYTMPCTQFKETAPFLYEEISFASFVILT